MYRVRKLARTLVEGALQCLFKLSLPFREPGRELVTVVVPLFDEERYLPECLASLQRQSWRSFECIVVDDASRDRSPDIAAEVCRADPRFRVVRHAANRGLPAARNTGLHLARGRWITFLDADDALFPHSLWLRVRALRERGAPDVAGAYARVVSVPERGTSLAARLARACPLPDDEDLDFPGVRGECPFNAHAPLLETELLRRFGGFDEAMKEGAEDWELWLRLLRHGYRFVPARCFGGVYRQKAGSMVRTLSARHAEVACGLIDRAFAPTSEPPCIESPPFHLRRGCGEYLREVAKARRRIPFATMAWLGGDLEGFLRTLEEIDDDVWFLLPRHAKIGDLVREGVARYHCLSAGSRRLDRGALAAARREIRLAIESSARPRP